jgi:hypothetical protein
MGGDGGGKWAESYDSGGLDFNGKVGNLTLGEACPAYGITESLLERLKSKRIFMCQIGSSSGREIAYFAKKYPEQKFSGTDIYEEVIKYSADSHRLPNLTFELFSAKNIHEKLSALTGFDCIIVFSSGSLQYVQPEHIDLFFMNLSRIPNLKIILNEPGDETKGSPDKLGGSRYRGSFSYTHNYKYYAERNGLKTVECRIVRPYHPLNDTFNVRHKHTIHYNYYGET